MERLASGLYVPPYLQMGWWPCGGCESVSQFCLCDGTTPSELYLDPPAFTATGSCLPDCDIEPTYTLTHTGTIPESTYTVCSFRWEYGNLGNCDPRYIDCDTAYYHTEDPIRLRVYVEMYFGPFAGSVQFLDDFTGGDILACDAVDYDLPVDYLSTLMECETSSDARIYV